VLPLGEQDVLQDTFTNISAAQTPAMGFCFGPRKNCRSLETVVLASMTNLPLKLPFFPQSFSIDETMFSKRVFQLDRDRTFPQ